MADFTWRLADIVAKPSPPRFKMSAAMYEPLPGNARGLRNQPHLFGHFGVKDFLGGQNQLLFTYGATSAGKTFTMQGEHGNSGIIPRAIDTVFNTIAAKVSETAVQPSGFNRVVSISQAEQEQQRSEKQSVFRLGLDLQKKSRPPSPDTSVLSGCR